ncbi:hypothetical protein HK101_009676 [Irineochytrium annulatum]|nr:hypothetical protein HK101_009676 [Irineochytrium annulatum]
MNTLDHRQPRPSPQRRIDVDEGLEAARSLLDRARAGVAAAATLRPDTIRPVPIFLSGPPASAFVPAPAHNTLNTPPTTSHPQDRTPQPMLLSVSPLVRSEQTPPLLATAVSQFRNTLMRNALALPPGSPTTAASSPVFRVAGNAGTRTSDPDTTMQTAVNLAASGSGDDFATMQERPASSKSMHDRADAAVGPDQVGKTVASQTSLPSTPELTTGTSRRKPLAEIVPVQVNTPPVSMRKIFADFATSPVVAVNAAAAGQMESGKTGNRIRPEFSRIPVRKSAGDKADRSSLRLPEVVKLDKRTVEASRPVSMQPGPASLKQEAHSRPTTPKNVILATNISAGEKEIVHAQAPDKIVVDVQEIEQQMSVLETLQKRMHTLNSSFLSNQRSLVDEQGDVVQNQTTQLKRLRETYADEIQNMIPLLQNAIEVSENMREKRVKLSQEPARRNEPPSWIRSTSPAAPVYVPDVYTGRTTSPDPTDLALKRISADDLRRNTASATESGPATTKSSEGPETAIATPEGPEPMPTPTLPSFPLSPSRPSPVRKELPPSPVTGFSYSNISKAIEELGREKTYLLTALEGDLRKGIDYVPFEHRFAKEAADEDVVAMLLDEMEVDKVVQADRLREEVGRRIMEATGREC